MTHQLNGATRLFVIVGDPIAQVKAPGGMTAAFAARGHNAVLVPMHVAPADLPAAIEGVGRARNLDGICVTIPHKFAGFAMCRETSVRARHLGVVNVMRRAKGGGWHGDMLDGLGFIGALRAKGFAPEGTRALLVGAGGAGSAIGHALCESGTRDLAIHDADTSRRDQLIAKLASVAKTVVTIGSADPSGFDLIAHATPAGMRAGDAMPVEIGKLAPTTFVGCVITVPAASPLIEAARKLGCPTSTGTDMYKAVEALMLDFWLGGATATSVVT